MTPEQIEQMKADREAGTDGPWASSHRKKPNGMYATQVYPQRDTYNTIATIHWHAIDTGYGQRTDREELARRIARVPDLEAEVLRLREALEWYEVQVSCFARATDETADFAEEILDRDAGKIARAALKGDSHE